MTSASYQVAIAQPAQFAAIREVERAAESVFPLDDLPSSMRGATLATDAELAAALRAGLLWCAQDAGGQVVGFALALWLGRDLHLDELDVHPAHQRRGIGRALIEAVRAHASARGAKRLTLTTYRFVPWNMPWYERLGFVALGERELPPALAEIFEEEIARGLARERRVAMALPL